MTGDVVVRQETREGTLVYALCAFPGPAQYLVRTREQATAQALAFATRARMRAGFANGHADFVPPGGVPSSEA